MKIFGKNWGETSVMAMIPEEGTCRVIYLLEPLKNMPGLEDYVKEDRCAVVSVFGMDWERDLTPWPAPKVLKRGDDFSGGARQFLTLMEEEIIPAVEKECVPEGKEADRSIVGISLAGLFSIWATMNGGPFRSLASVSGSLWYDGFMEYLKENDFPTAPEGIYLSVGDTEKNTRNPRMATVEDNTREAASLFASKGIKTFFELNPGNHFSDTVPRLRKAVDHLLSLAKAQ